MQNELYVFRTVPSGDAGETPEARRSIGIADRVEALRIYF